MLGVYVVSFDGLYGILAVPPADYKQLSVKEVAPTGVARGGFRRKRLPLTLDEIEGNRLVVGDFPLRPLLVRSSDAVELVINQLNIGSWRNG